MKISESINIFKDHQKSCIKPKTLNSYIFLLDKFESHFIDRLVESIKSDEIYGFLEAMTSGSAKATRRLRYAELKAFYNFVIENCGLSIPNPCQTPMLSKAFKPPKRKAKQIMDKEAVDEMIYNSKTLRDRLIMELMARCGLRIGELLGLKVKDVKRSPSCRNRSQNGWENTSIKKIFLWRIESFQFVIRQPEIW